MIEPKLIVNVIIGVWIYNAIIDYLAMKIISAALKSYGGKASKVFRKSFKERLEELEKEESENNQNKTK